MGQVRAGLTLQPPDDSMMTTPAPSGPAIIHRDFRPRPSPIALSTVEPGRLPRPTSTVRLLHTPVNASQE